MALVAPAQAFAAAQQLELEEELRRARSVEVELEALKGSEEERSAELKSEEQEMMQALGIEGWENIWLHLFVKPNEETSRQFQFCFISDVQHRQKVENTWNSNSKVIWDSEFRIFSFVTDRSSFGCRCPRALAQSFVRSKQPRPESWRPVAGSWGIPAGNFLGIHFRFVFKKMGIDPGRVTCFSNLLERCLITVEGLRLWKV